MKKEYQKAEIEVIEISREDVIMTSDSGCTWEAEEGQTVEVKIRRRSMTRSQAFSMEFCIFDDHNDL